MYYKYVMDGQIVDATDHLAFVRYQERHRLFLHCETEAEADGVLSSDGSTIYLLSGKAQIGDLGFVAYSEIEEEEYLRIREELDAGEIIDDDEPDADTDSGAKTRLQQLEEQVAALQEVNDMLTECLLEMSEIVYG